MNPAELIPRLEAHTAVLEKLGGLPEIDQQEISFALAKIDDPLALDLIRAKFGLNDVDRNRMLGRFYHDSNALAKARHWHLDGSGILVTVCSAVLDDYLNPHICKICMGRKHAMIGAKLVLCENCNGAGVKYPTDQDRAKRIGINLKIYRKVWGPRFAQLLADLSGREITGLSLMAQALE